MKNKNEENFSRIKLQISNILEEQYFKELPQEVRKIIARVKVDLFNYEVKQKEINDLNQEVDLEKLINKIEEQEIKDISENIATENEVIELLVEATGYNNWSIDNNEEMKERELHHLKNYHDVNHENLETYGFYRSFGNRDSINGIRITTLPGLFFISINTDRSELSFDKLLNKKEAIKKIKFEFENN